MKFKRVYDVKFEGITIFSGNHRDAKIAYDTALKLYDVMPNPYYEMSIVLVYNKTLCD